MDLQPDGTLLGQIMRPLKRVGVYVPGGKAAYPSSVLMNVIPAQVAGVPEIVMVTPPCDRRQGGHRPVYSGRRRGSGCEGDVPRRRGAGGSRAGLRHGDRSRRSIKSVGPGNIYVALAKRAVFGVVDIDSIAGPSEIVVLADDTADPAYVAADLLSQAEHDEMASAILVTPSPKLARSGRCGGGAAAGDAAAESDRRAVDRQLRSDPAGGFDGRRRWTSSTGWRRSIWR